MLAHTILTITDGGGFLLATTAGSHGLTDVDINIADHSNNDYNGGPFSITVLSPTTFRFAEVAYSGDGTGGTWSLA